MKKLSKQLAVMAITGCMIASVFPSYADNRSNDIQQVLNPDNTISRTYVKPQRTSKDSSISKEEEIKNIKNILLDLGMEQDFIDNLTQEQLEFYSESAVLVGNLAYTKTDEDGNVEYITEEKAIKESEEIMEQYNQKIDEMQEDGRQTEFSAREKDTYEDSYMRVFHLVSQHGNTDKFRYSTDARWLTMPFFRGYDSLGSCSQYGAIIPYSQSGYYTFDRKTSTSSTNDEITRLSSSDFNNAVNGNFFGTAAVFNLPNDRDSQFQQEYYSDFKAHVEYDGKVTEPDHRLNFNSTGTYDHSRFRIGFTPSISISKTGPSASIGLNIQSSKDSRSATVLVGYRP